MKFEAASLAASFNATRLAGRPRLLIGFAGIGLLLIVRRGSKLSLPQPDQCNRSAFGNRL
jgi:hypothetical protein